MSILTLGKRSVETNLAIPTIVGVTMPPSGSAIVSVTLDTSLDRRHPIRVCTGIERAPYDVGKVYARVAALDLGPRDLVVVDGAGAGTALWIALGSPRNRKFKLYEGIGRERQKLVDPFPSMMIDGTFSFAPRLAHQEAMLKAWRATGARSRTTASPATSLRPRCSWPPDTGRGRGARPRAGAGVSRGLVDSPGTRLRDRGQARPGSPPAGPPRRDLGWRMRPMSPPTPRLVTLPKLRAPASSWTSSPGSKVARSGRNDTPELRFDSGRRRKW